MTWPDDDVMWTLDTLSRADEFRAVIETGQLVVVLPWGEEREVGYAEWDALLTRGWVEVVDPDPDAPDHDGRQVNVTEQGRKSLERWHEERKRPSWKLKRRAG